ncbi:hypothetical protein OG762_04030 [Streptomyces sp. NBC_01136]|uniref:hypothetical protein n=1 Tax=unclassified Streptomyces TaxID=2593676 RepID=UPI00324D45CC|nr:hypothetical protein OG762_04030 [Streptomyces sp. NBC_01136]
MRNIVARPSVIARGGQLTVTVDGEACQRPGSTVSSRVFRTTRLRRVGGDTFAAVVTVDRDARPGWYDITARCGDRRLTRPDAFTVIGGVSGGLGGSSSSGATPTDMAIGGGLVAAAVVGGGVFWMRRRSEKRT